MSPQRRAPRAGPARPRRARDRARGDAGRTAEGRRPRGTGAGERRRATSRGPSNPQRGAGSRIRRPNGFARAAGSRDRSRGERRPSAGAESVERILTRQPWESLHTALRTAGADVAIAEERLREFCRRVLEWNRRVSNLISRHDESRIVERHVLESVAPAHWLAESGHRRWLDFGSGAGFPAIPLAIAGVPGTWTLVESRRTKTLFIRKTLEDMKLEHFEVVHDRLETLAASPPEPSFDGFVSRATMRLAPTLALARHLVAPGGSAFLWKGSGREDEMSGDPSWRDAWEFTGLMGVGSGPNVVARFVCKI